MSSLLMASNFQNLTQISTSQYNLLYTIYEYRSPAPTSLIPVTTTVSLIAKQTTPILALAANFTPLPLCNPTTNQKYTGGAACTSIVTLASNAIYSSNENTPFVCSNNYYFDPLNSIGVCGQQCTGNVTRSPATITTNAICNYDCQNTSLCPRGSFAELSNLPSNYQCSAGFTRMGYKCTNVTVTDSKYFNITISCFIFLKML